MPTVDSDCLSGQICNDSVDYGGFGDGTCVTGNRGSVCTVDSDCPSGQICSGAVDSGGFGDGACVTGDRGGTPNLTHLECDPINKACKNVLGQRNNDYTCDGKTAGDSCEPIY